MRNLTVAPENLKVLKLTPPPENLAPLKVTMPPSSNLALSNLTVPQENWARQSCHGRRPCLRSRNPGLARTSSCPSGHAERSSRDLRGFSTSSPRRCFRFGDVTLTGRRLKRDVCRRRRSYIAPPERRSGSARWGGLRKEMVMLWLYLVVPLIVLCGVAVVINWRRRRSFSYESEMAAKVARARAESKPP